MKLTRNLLYVGGAASFVFFLFHLWLGWRIHGFAQLDPGIRSLLEMLNGGGALLVLFLASASWLVARAPSPTALGQLVIVLGCTVYLLRAFAEFVVSPRVHPAIFATCLAAGLLYAAALMFGRTKDLALTPATAATGG
jgi:hypothetical protein